MTEDETKREDEIVIQAPKREKTAPVHVIEDELYDALEQLHKFRYMDDPEDLVNALIKIDRAHIMIDDKVEQHEEVP